LNVSVYSLLALPHLMAMFASGLVSGTAHESPLGKGSARDTGIACLEALASFALSKALFLLSKTSASTLSESALAAEWEEVLF
jgi:hypothetical protein